MTGNDIKIQISYLFGIFSHLSSGHLQQQSLSQHIQWIHNWKWMFRPFYWCILRKEDIYRQEMKRYFECYMVSSESDILSKQLSIAMRSFHLPGKVDPAHGYGHTYIWFSRSREILVLAVAGIESRIPSSQSASIRGKKFLPWPDLLFVYSEHMPIKNCLAEEIDSNCFIRRD